jgi:hypothetical protein
MEGATSQVPYTSTALIEPKGQTLSEIEVKEEILGNIRKLVDAYKPGLPGDNSSFRLFDPKGRFKQSSAARGALSALSEQEIRDLAVKSLAVYRHLAEQRDGAKARSVAAPEDQTVVIDSA